MVLIVFSFLRLLEDCFVNPFSGLLKELGRQGKARLLLLSTRYIDVELDSYFKVARKLIMIHTLVFAFSKLSGLSTEKPINIACALE